MTQPFCGTWTCPGYNLGMNGLQNVLDYILLEWLSFRSFDITATNCTVIACISFCLRASRELVQFRISRTWQAVYYTVEGERIPSTLIVDWNIFSAVFRYKQRGRLDNRKGLELALINGMIHYIRGIPLTDAKACKTASIQNVKAQPFKISK